MSYLTLGNRTFKEIIKELPDWPDPIEFVDGTITYNGSDFARSIGWTDLHPNLNQTNMVHPMFFIRNDDTVFAKDVIRLDKRPYWVQDWFVPRLGFGMWSKYCQPSFGFEDGNTKPTDPISGEFKQQTIDCGCNLHRLIGNPFWTRKGMFWKIAAIDYYSHPNPDEINYYLTPEYITKQTLASISQNEDVAYITHQKHGDLVWPKLSRYQLMMPDLVLERFPRTPFKTEYLGAPATILGYCFQASKVYGLFSDGWRVIEESLITGIGSAYYDRRVYVKDWVKTPPPTIKGFTQFKDTKFDWQL